MCQSIALRKLAKQPKKLVKNPIVKTYRNFGNSTKYWKFIKKIVLEDPSQNLGDLEAYVPRQNKIKRIKHRRYSQVTSNPSWKDTTQKVPSHLRVHVSSKEPLWGLICKIQASIGVSAKIWNFGKVDLTTKQLNELDLTNLWWRKTRSKSFGTGRKN